MKRAWLLTALLFGSVSGCRQSASQHLSEGDELLARGSAQAALKEYMEALRLEPSMHAERGIGLAHAALGALGEAEEHLRLALAVQPGDTEARLALGRLFGQQGRDQEAQQELALVIEDQPHHTLAWQLLGAYALQPPEVQQALAGLEASVEGQKTRGGGPDRESLILLNDLAKRSGKTEAAANYARAARLASLGSEAATLELARVCARRKQLELTYELLHALLEKRPSELEAWQLLAATTLELGRTSEARSAFLRLPKERQNQGDARLIKARIALASELQAEAAAELKGLLEASPEGDPALRREARYLFARALGSERRYDEARAELEQLLREAPDAFEARVLLARHALEQGHAEQVASSLGTLPAAHAELGAAQELLGRAALADADFETAARAFEQLRALAPDKPEGRYGLARAFERLGRVEEARGLLFENAQAFPAHAPSLRTLGELIRRGEGGKAADRFSMQHWAAHASQPDVATLEGEWWLERKQQQRGLEAYRRAVTQQPDFVPAVAALGQFYARRKLSAQAFSVVDAALAQRSDDLGLLLVAAEVSAAAGAPDQARQHIEKAFAIVPGYPPALAAQARLAAESGGDLGAAQALAARAQAAAPGNADVLDAVGWVSFLQRDFEPALERLKLAARYAKDNPRIRYHLAAALAAAGDTASAKQSFAQARSLDPEVPDPAQLGARPRRKR